MSAMDLNRLRALLRQVADNALDAYINEGRRPDVAAELAVNRAMTDGVRVFIGGEAGDERG
jgi:ethanolamine utilization cobalamin adenosyltransferase